MVNQTIPSNWEKSFTILLFACSYTSADCSLPNIAFKVVTLISTLRICANCFNSASEGNE